MATRASRCCPPPSCTCTSRARSSRSSRSRSPRATACALRYADLDELRRAYAFDDLQSFLDLYYELTAVLQRPEDFADLADAYFARAAAQGVRHAEVFFDPQAHTARGVPLEVVMDGPGRGLPHGAGAARPHRAADRLLPPRPGPGGGRGRSLPRLLPYRDLVIGVGLDSAEVGHPPELFERVFARAADEGLHRVAHAGEEGPPAYVRSALDRLGVERVDHGIRSLEDPSLVARLREEQVPLTVCPLSNVALRGVARPRRAPAAPDAGRRAAGHGQLRRPRLLRRLPARQPDGRHPRPRADRGGTGGVLAENSFRASFLPEAGQGSGTSPRWPRPARRRRGCSRPGPGTRTSAARRGSGAPRRRRPPRPPTRAAWSAVASAVLNRIPVSTPAGTPSCAAARAIVVRRPRSGHLDPATAGKEPSIRVSNPRTRRVELERALLVGDRDADRADVGDAGGGRGVGHGGLLVGGLWR